jgi:hypothetical protein
MVQTYQGMFVGHYMRIIRPTCLSAVKNAYSHHEFRLFSPPSFAHFIGVGLSAVYHLRQFVAVFGLARTGFGV